MIKDELAAYTSNLVGRIGEEAAEALFVGQIGEATPVVGAALRRGQRAPLFTLVSASGHMSSLADRIACGPVVLTFYRGGWCPYCNIALRAMQSRLQDIKDLGGALFAVSPEQPDHSLSTTEKLSLEFDVLSDPGNAVARQYGLVYRVSKDAQERLLSLGRDLVAHNGSETWELPVTATYVIDHSGIIIFDHVDADYRERLDPLAIVDALKLLGSNSHRSNSP
jgi:peroxiredoxin